MKTIIVNNDLAAHVQPRFLLGGVHVFQCVGELASSNESYAQCGGLELDFCLMYIGEIHDCIIDVNTP
ncbi:MAG: hypothetical protein M1608_06030 [Candidatus Omnitrophica bacterium]|nr:hypothetical protein [Candidatus Omnitrophota bacterium]